MSKIRILASGTILAVFTNISFAGTMGVVEPLPERPWFLEFGSGVSWVKDVHFRGLDPSRWNSSPNGYDSSLGTKPLYTAGIGYMFNPLLSVDASYTFRGIYKYRKYQLASAIPNANASNPLGNRTRYFDLNSNAVLVNGTLYGQGWSDKLVYDLGNSAFIQPIIGGGIGVSYNTISNFHTVLADNAAVTTVMQDLSTVSFAWQANAALELKKDRFSFDVGYRYFHAGPFHSNNALITRVSASGTPLTTNLIPRWSSHLAANELYLTGKVAF